MKYYACTTIHPKNDKESFIEVFGEEVITIMKDLSESDYEILCKSGFFEMIEDTMTMYQNISFDDKDYGIAKAIGFGVTEEKEPDTYNEITTSAAIHYCILHSIFRAIANIKLSISDDDSAANPKSAIKWLVDFGTFINQAYESSSGTVWTISLIAINEETDVMENSYTEEDLVNIGYKKYCDKIEETEQDTEKES